jgi:hypothetical protein
MPPVAPGRPAALRRPSRRGCGSARATTAARTRLREGAGRLAAPLRALHRQANELLPAGRTPTKSGSRRCAATRSSSTSGPPGAARAASSSRTSSELAAATASGRLPRRRQPGLRRRRRTFLARRRSPTQLHRPDEEIAEALGASRLPDTAFYDRAASSSTSNRGPTERAELRPTSSATRSAARRRRIIEPWTSSSSSR